MDEIKEMLDQAMDEAFGAKEYMECALNHREKNKTVADMYSTMANAEMNHAEALLNMAFKEVTLKKQGNDPHANMADTLYDFVKEKVNDVMVKAKVMMSMYR